MGVSSALPASDIASRFNQTCTSENGITGKFVYARDCDFVTSLKMIGREDNIKYEGSSNNELVVCCVSRNESVVVPEMGSVKSHPMPVYCIDSDDIIASSGKANHHKHMAALGHWNRLEEETFDCGGVLISDRFVFKLHTDRMKIFCLIFRFVLTAAYCSSMGVYQPEFVRLGRVTFLLVGIF